MNETVLVTGASGGIGLELAGLFAKDGYDLVLAARSADKLEEIKRELEKRHGISVTVLPQNVSGRENVEALWSAVEARGLTIDILVNNAGYGLYGPFAETDLTDELNMIDLNVSALTHLTKLAVRGMVSRGKGRILNVASLAAFQPGPLMAVYYATKAYVLSFSEALAHELQGTGVTVTALCPGATATGFEKRAKLESSRLFKMGVMDVGTVSRAGYRGLLKGKRIVVPGFKNVLMVNASRFLPRRVVTAFVRRIQGESR
ncbi:SDR family oxidoreductase [Paenibacillus aurantius]|uniref:SDR family oxidoreductase n=1 Tax=Paenibacillus aurantius TaxID=2918900 RepID=A0AA96RGJ9_9BACL|nr:SDR family oxidoreductase [Paenibacillus aurantius]WNQ10124.1 SDR family oxidoreductase [Paenibacillus aurantius]